MDIKIIHGDFLEKVKLIPDKSIDFILTDPPYQITQSKWDKIIPFNKYLIQDNKVMYLDDFLIYSFKKGFNYKQSLSYFKKKCHNGMWDEIKRISKKNTITALFGSEPFSSKLIQSNKKNFKYNWYWKKNVSTNFLNAKKQPLRNIEYISIFYSGKYTPQKTKGHKPVNTYTKKLDGETLGKTSPGYSGGGSTERYPNQLLEFKVVNNDHSNGKKYHSNQKPIDLLEYLIKTHSDENDTILDFTSGSFSTAIACLKQRRNFVGIESSLDYCNIGAQRINEYISKENISINFKYI